MKMIIISNVRYEEIVLEMRMSEERQTISICGLGIL